MKNKIEIWLYGYGHMGKLHAQKLSQRPDVSVAIIDPKYHFPKPHRQQPDGVIIATPTATHHHLALPFLQQNIPVLIEKSLATSNALCQQLAQYPSACVGHIERFGPIWNHLKHQRPKFFQADRITSFSGRGEDVDVILDLMIHDIDLCLQLMGNNVIEIRASGMPVLTDQIDIVNARLEFPSGVAQLTASRVAQNPSRKLRLFSTGTYYSADLYQRKLIQTSLHHGQLSHTPISIPNIDALEMEHAAFIDFIREQKPFPCTAIHGANAVAVALAIRDAL